MLVGMEHSALIGELPTAWHIQAAGSGEALAALMPTD